MAPLISIGVLIVATLVAAKNLDPLSDDFIAHINSKQSSWKAGRNFHLNTSLTLIKGLMGVVESPRPPKLPTVTHDADLIASLPDSFDPREKWTHCPSLSEIRDQGSCGSSWALGAVEVMTDRVCIFSNGTKHFHFSAQDLVSCCADCGNGCSGGSAILAFQYWQDVGIVSGGQYQTSEGCRPYEIAPCEHYVEGPRPDCDHIDPTPKCVKKCETGYNVEYDKDKHRAKKVYSLKEEDDIKAELYKNGPVEGVIILCEDFFYYKSGVYQFTSGICIGRHAVKIMGWGQENGDKYWLCANSWNNDWGDNGFFKILRGEDHLYIESDCVTGEPDLNGF